MKLPLFYGRFPHFPHYFPHFPYIIGYARLAKLLYETLLFGCKLNIILNGKWTSFRWCGWHLKSDLMQDVRAWGWRAAIKSVTRDIEQHYGVVGVPFILLLSSSPLNSQKYPPTSGAESPWWAGILRFRSIRVNLFGLWFSLNPRFDSTIGWCRTSLLLQCHR